MNATLDRFKQGQSRPDLFSHFVQEDGQLHPDMTMADVNAGVRAMILAGEPLGLADKGARVGLLPFPTKQARIRLLRLSPSYLNIYPDILSGQRSVIY